MIKNISNEPVTLRWDGRERVLQPKEQMDIRDFNVPQDLVLLTEAKVGSKHSGKVEIVHGNSRTSSRRKKKNWPSVRPRSQKKRRPARPRSNDQQQERAGLRIQFPLLQAGRHTC